jgi:hypothetical protein
VLTTIVVNAEVALGSLLRHLYSNTQLAAVSIHLFAHAFKTSEALTKMLEVCRLLHASHACGTACDSKAFFPGLLRTPLQEAGTRGYHLNFTALLQNLPGESAAACTDLAHFAAAIAPLEHCSASCAACGKWHAADVCGAPGSLRKDDARVALHADPWAVRELFQRWLWHTFAPTCKAAVTLRVAACSGNPLTIACCSYAEVLPLNGRLRPATVCPCHSMPVDGEAADGTGPQAGTAQWHALTYERTHRNNKHFCRQGQS